jgi:hypothetical protein
MTGGTGAELGDQTAGVFQLRTIDPRVERSRTAMGLSLTNVRAMSVGKFAGGNGGWLVSGRRGYLELAFKLADIDDSLYPQYNDVTAKVVMQTRGGGELGIHALHAGDRLRYQDAREPRLESHYASDYVWTTWQNEHSEAAAWFGRLDWARAGSGADLNRGWPSVRVSDDRGFTTVGVRQDVKFTFGDRAELRVGGEVRRDAADFDYTRSTRRNEVIGHTLTTTAESLHTALAPSDVGGAMYLTQRARLGAGAVLEAGLRYSPPQRGAPGITDPRLGLAWQPRTGTTLRSSWGSYTRHQALFSMQVQDGLQSVASPDRSRQFVAGWDQDWMFGVSSRVEAYDRKLIAISPAFENVTTSINAFPELAYDRVYVAPTDGRSRGVELSLTKAVGRYADWNASLARSRATETVNGRETSRPSDQLVALHGDWSIHPASNRWRLTLSGFWHTGAPYTPDSVRIDTLVTANGTQFPRATWFAGSLYSQRVSAYHRLDARWTRFIDTHRGRVVFFVEVYNLLNTENERDHYTNVAFTGLSARYYNGTRTQLPRIPSFGFTWEF